MMCIQLPIETPFLYDGAVYFITKTGSMSIMQHGRISGYDLQKFCRTYDASKPMKQVDTMAYKAVKSAIDAIVTDFISGLESDGSEICDKQQVTPGMLSTDEIV